MGKCFKCSKLIGIEKISLLDGKIELCFDCFFEGLPDSPSKMSPDYGQKKAERDKLIQEKIEKIIGESSNNLGGG
ncbi:hypothetical protein [Brevibacillus laterosporus]|uniref:hypothetical protein n=1 Tax=Brevibacillus laterosporus TaxID=1465 RepID=UPI003D1F4AB6